jgi:hypothetical protein
LVEAYRDDNGRPKQRTVATLGRLDQLNSELESVITGLLRVTWKSAPAALASAPSLSFESARDYGDVWALTELWNSLGFDCLWQLFRRTRHTIDIEAPIRVMGLNRLCDPDSKLGVLRWVETVTFPGVMADKIDHHTCCARWTLWSSIRTKSTRYSPFVAPHDRSGSCCRVLRHDDHPR